MLLSTVDTGAMCIMTYFVRMSINTKFIVACVSLGESAADDNTTQAETYREKVSN